MSFTVRLICYALIPLAVSGVLSYIKSRSEKHSPKEKFESVHLPPFVAVLGAVCSALFLIPTVITSFHVEETGWFAVLCFLFFALLGASLTVAYFNCRIEYDDDGFTQKSFFGIKRRYSYGDLTGIRHNVHETYLFIGKKRVLVDGLALNGTDFVAFARKKYRTLNDGNALPTVKPKKDIFKGNVKGSGELVFVYSLISVLLIGLNIYCAYELFKPYDKADFELSNVFLAEYKYVEEDLVMQGSDGREYRIRFIESDFDTSAVEAVCDGKTDLFVYFNKITPDHKEPFYAVGAIEKDGEILVGFDETKHMVINEQWPVLVVTGSLLLIWTLLFAVTVYVGRNPKKFSRRFVKLFIKEEHLNF